MENEILETEETTAEDSLSAALRAVEKKVIGAIENFQLPQQEPGQAALEQEKRRKKSEEELRVEALNRVRLEQFRKGRENPVEEPEQKPENDKPVATLLTGIVS